MNIKQLKKAIENLPDNMDVFINQSYNDFKYVLVESAKPRMIGFKEEDGPILAREKVFVITDDEL